jgi:hypothetical protein
VGRLAIRTATAALIQSAGLPYVGTVFPARPVIIQEDAYVQTMNGQAITESVNGSACIIVVNIPGDLRNRYADSGRVSRADFNIHRMVLELFFASTGGDGIAAQEDYDTVVDALMPFIRQNPTLAGSSWSAGEYKAGVKHEQSEAYTSEDGTTILTNGWVQFEAWEQDVGPTA